MTYFIIHVICGLISILLQISDGDCDLKTAGLLFITGPIGLVIKIFFKVNIKGEKNGI